MRLTFFFIAAFCRLTKSLNHSQHMGWLVGAVGIERTSYQIRLVPSMRCSHRRLPTGTNGTSVNCVRLRSRRNCAEIRIATERLPSNKEGTNPKCFAGRRLRILSPEISPLVVPKLYRTPFLYDVTLFPENKNRPPPESELWKRRMQAVFAKLVRKSQQLACIS
jgi:hypothetical protein